ncbi:hypothetical protein CLOP_g20431, partial [Closterium sp. NIES-67]
LAAWGGHRPAPIAAAISTISAKLIDTPPAPFQEASRAA